MKRALIVGASGQDGNLLARLLKSKGYFVIGVSRGPSSNNCDEAIRLDVQNAGFLVDIVHNRRPAEIYYLAAHHQSSQGRSVIDSGEEASKTLDVNLNSYLAILQAALQIKTQPRVFYACTSLIFGNPTQTPQTEQTPPGPTCLYSMSKLAARQISEDFRDREGMHVSVGILYNHESSLRQEQFLSKRIANGIAAIQRGESSQLTVGDLGARCDWGYAGDFVEAMWRMLQLDCGDTYVVSSDELHSVRDWVEAYCQLAGLNPEQVVKQDPSLLNRKRPLLLGDSRKLRTATGWMPSTNFAEIVRKIYQNEL